MTDLERWRAYDRVAGHVSEFGELPKDLDCETKREIDLDREAFLRRVRERTYERLARKRKGQR